MPKRKTRSRIEVPTSSLFWKEMLFSVLSGDEGSVLGVWDRGGRENRRRRTIVERWMRVGRREEGRWSRRAERYKRRDGGDVKRVREKEKGEKKSDDGSKIARRRGKRGGGNFLYSFFRTAADLWAPG
ncbi:hypothetical protein Dda_8465 [Drechslerella dactyloides]|uniref:Uncharacterized protein n=1 Tax=Drechslerella dactyloides TaxID=74499 RepID=A0AAD6NFQ0_DREDA|nr:hypothetical protein Dda_8465 [Drechslerella dactyloides]